MTEFAPAGGGGTNFYSPSGGAVVFAEVLLTAAVVANALADPSDTPTQDTLRIQRDAAGAVGLFHYSVDLAAWAGVQLGL